jgi:hypothetical protein
MYYLVTIGYETEQLDRMGNPRQQKVKYIFEAESVEETTILAAKYSQGDTRSSELLSVTHMPIEAVISPKTFPEFYKSK